MSTVKLQLKSISYSAPTFFLSIRAQEVFGKEAVSPTCPKNVTQKVPRLSIYQFNYMRQLLLALLTTRYKGFGNLCFPIQLP